LTLLSLHLSFPQIYFTPSDNMRRGYFDRCITDIDLLFDVDKAKAEYDRLLEELEQARAEYRLVKRLIRKHYGKDDEWLFYLGARTREIEIQEEIECLMPEIDAAEVIYRVALQNSGGYQDGA